MANETHPTLSLEEELFVIPTGENGSRAYFLYAPLRGSVLKVNPGTLGLLRRIKTGEPYNDSEQEIVSELLKSRIIRDSEPKQRDFSDSRGYRPTSVTLLPTFNCNLRCTYCYARGGEEPGEDMSIEVARASVDLIVKNALRDKQRRASLGFHGGGEPLLHKNMGLVREIVEYFNHETEKYTLKGNVSSATNGVIARDDLEWVAGKFSNLNISLDGPKDIQDKQRPKAGNQGSFDEVVETIRYLEERKQGYGIRATITDESVKRMPEIVDFFRSISTLKRFHLEPLFECGRCRTSKVHAPTSEEFLENLIKTREHAEKLGIEIYYSGAKLGEIGNTFCGAAGKNFFVNPHGKVTACLEVCRETQEWADVFMIGEYNPEKQGFSFKGSRIKRLKERTVDKIPNCSDCYAKFNCRGDCLAKVLEQSGSLTDTRDNSRCHVNQGLLLHEIEKRCNSKEKACKKCSQCGGI